MWLVIIYRMKQLSISFKIDSAWERFVQDGCQNLDLISLYHAKGEDPFDQLITGDEKWAIHFTWKSASKQCVANGGNCPVKVKWDRLAGKVNLTVFWDNQGIQLEEYVQKSVKIMKETYFDFFLHLWEAIKKKYPSKQSRGMILLHDKARAHKVQLIMFLLNDFHWDMLGHPIHSSDLTPSNYHLFARIHQWLGGQRFSSDAEVKEVVHNYFQKLDKNFYALGILKLFNQYEKCIAHCGD